MHVKKDSKALVGYHRWLALGGVGMGRRVGKGCGWGGVLMWGTELAIEKGSVAY